MNDDNYDPWSRSDPNVTRTDSTGVEARWHESWWENDLAQAQEQNDILRSHSSAWYLDVATDTCDDDATDSA